MAKYNRLSKMELESLKDQFITFLIAQGIEANMWQEMERTDPDKYNLLVDQFSDYIITQSLQNTRYVTKLTGNILSTYYCANRAYQQFVVQLNPKLMEAVNTEDDLLQSLKNDKMLTEIEYNHTEFPIRRDQFIYSLINDFGYQIDHGVWYKQIAMVWANKQ